MTVFQFIKKLFTYPRIKKNTVPNSFDYLLEGIQVHDFGWRYIYVNNALVRYSHYTKEALLGSTLMEKYPGIENSDLFKVLDRCMKSRASEYLETEFVFPDGSKADFELRIQPVPEGLSILSINITELIKAQKKQNTSEIYYRSLIEQANDTIYILDASPKPRFIDINQSGCDLLGYTKEEILQLTVFDIVFEEDHANSYSKVKDLNLGIPIRNERRLRKKDGTAVEAELSAKKMEDGNIMVVARDISERKKAEAELQNSENRFRALIENSNDVISLMDEKFQVIYRSPSAERITGWTYEEIGNTSGIQNIHPDDLNVVKEIMQQLMMHPGKALKTSFRSLHKNGSYIWIDGIGINLLHHENVKAIVFNYQDVTEQRQAKEQLKMSELYYRSIFEQANDAIYLTDHMVTQRFIDINPSGCAMLGYTKEEFLKLRPLDLLYEEDLENNPIKIGQLHSGGPVINERRLRRKDGTAVVTESSGKMLGDGNFIIFAHDITNRKMAEKEIKTLNENLEQKVMERTLALENTILQLKESEEKFQIAFNSSAAGISITRLTDATFVDVNNEFIAMTGFSKEELLGRNSGELGMQIDTERREELLQEIRKNGSARNFEFVLRNKSGKKFVIIGSVETIVLKGEKYALNILYDITERKKIEEQLAAVNKELTAFSYSVSHDLRAPLRAVNGFAQMLLEDCGPQLNKEGNRLISQIINNATKMATLIDDLLSFSQLGRKEIQKIEIDLHKMMEDVILSFNKTTRHGAAIHLDVSHQVKADYRLLFQVLFNLLSNAVKYSSKKNQPEISICSIDKNGEIIITVKDNGAGFDMKYQDKLFGVFQRLHSTKEFEGTGVGLAIVERIISKHHGRVWAEGKVNEGAVFNLSLPK